MKSALLAIALLIAIAADASAQVAGDPAIQQLQADLSAMGTSQHHAIDGIAQIVTAYQKAQADLAKAEEDKAELVKWLQTAQAASSPH